jgi:hypothetical protein
MSILSTIFVVVMNDGKVNKKKKDNLRKKDARRAALILQTAEITGVSQRHVQRIVNGHIEITEKNEQVFAVFMDLKEGTNALLEAVKNTVPFRTEKKVKIA